MKCGAGIGRTWRCSASRRNFFLLMKMEVRECEMQTDAVPDIITLQRRTYANVATQAQVNMLGSKRPKELNSIKDKDSPPASPCLLRWDERWWG